MNKYTFKATIQVAGLFVAFTTISLITAALLRYFNPTLEQVTGIFLFGVLAYTTYNLISVRASILETRDRLNIKQ